ncbi:hypothetical protein D3C81_533550 [compost metagenome]
MLALAFDDTRAGIRRFGCPDTPDTCLRKVRGAAFGKNRQGIGMALVELGQGHVTACDTCQALPPA